MLVCWEELDEILGDVELRANIQVTHDEFDGAIDLRAIIKFVVFGQHGNPVP